MYCICAEGGTVSKQRDRTNVARSRDEPATIDDRDRFWIGGDGGTREHGSKNRSDTKIMDRCHHGAGDAVLRNARCRTPVVIDALPFDRRRNSNQRQQHDEPTPQTASSFSSASSSANSFPANGGHFSRRRQSLVEALSNPVPSTRSNSPISPAPVGLLASRSNAVVNVSVRPSSSVVAGSHEHQDNEHRLFAVDELIRCERDYVALLSALHEGFLKPACRHSELFDAHLVRAIFGNLHQLRSLHEKLLYDLEAAVVKTPLCLGSCFLQHVCTRPTFEAYSHYCNNHQRSCRRLSQLYEHEAYRTFFEECRRVCRLPTLRLDAFLLRPVQQLCRYPLLLATLLQRTPKTHHDHKSVTAALQATQQLLTVVNNRRRLFEQLQELARWQKTVADWKGPELLQTSSRLVYSGELVCTCYAVGESVPRWRKRVFVFLFDRLIVLCRKDRMKKQLVFKSRFELDGTNKSCLLSGGAWQLTTPLEAKRLLFKANSKQEAKLWLEALNKERYLVQQTGRLPTNEEKMLAIEMAKDPEEP